MNHYQTELKQLLLSHLVLLDHEPLVVETGVQFGQSTKAILEALDELGRGQLVSIDPKPEYRVRHQRWVLLEQCSYEAFPDVFAEFGPFDVFLHDSDHAAGCMVYEFEMAYGCVRDGGIIASDDYEWSNHKAWRNFIDKHGWTQNLVGAAAYVVKTGPVTNDIGATHEAAVAAANQRCSELRLGRYLPMRSDYIVDKG